MRLLFLLLPLLAFAQASEPCLTYYGNFAKIEERQEAQQLLKELGFNGYMRDFIGQLLNDPRVVPLSGQKKANLWREAVIELHKKQSFIAREFPVDADGIKGTAFIGGAPSHDIKTTLVFLDEPENGKIAFLFSSEDMVLLAEKGVTAQGLVKNLSPEEAKKLQDELVRKIKAPPIR